MPRFGGDSAPGAAAAREKPENPHRPAGRRGRTHPRTMTEFGFIDHIKELFAALPDNGFEGIGDDCAVLPVGEGESLVFTTDMLAEGVHFLRPANWGANPLP